MIKKFSSLKIKIWFEPMFFFGFFCGFHRCGSLRLRSVQAAAFPNFRGGNSSPPQAAKCVRTNSRILHQTGKLFDFSYLVPRERLELSQGCPYGILSPACLPVPPPRHELYKRIDLSKGF